MENEQGKVVKEKEVNLFEVFVRFLLYVVQSAHRISIENR